MASHAMFADDAKKIVRPFVAARKLRESLTTSWVQIQGIEQHVSPFGSRDLQLNKLIRDIEEGRVFLLDDSNGFGTIEGLIGGSDSFSTRVNAVINSGRKRPMSAVGYGYTESSINFDEYTPEPIKKEEPAEEQERTEFLCGWSECQKNQSKADAIAALLPGRFQQDKRALIDRHNEHLKSQVREGEIIVLPTREPKTEEELVELNELKAEARRVSAALHSVSEEEAQVAVRHLPLFDYVVSSEGYSESVGVAGSLSSGIGGHLEIIKDSLIEISQLYAADVLSAGSKKNIPASFFSKRRALFKRIDTALHRMTFNCVGIPVHTKLKRTLGLSTKSSVYRGVDLLVDGVLKGLAQRIEVIVSWIKGTKIFGLLCVALDSLGSIPVIKEAFTAKEGQPIKAISVETARIYGGYAAGNWGARAGAATLSVVVGAAGGGAVATGVAVLVGGAVGAYLGAKAGSFILSTIAETGYDASEFVIDNVSEYGGFFDWNVEQP